MTAPAAAVVTWRRCEDSAGVHDAADRWKAAGRRFRRPLWNEEEGQLEAVLLDDGGRPVEVAFCEPSGSAA